MATSPANKNRLFDGGKSFSLGVNSFAHPADLGKGQIAWGVNLWFKRSIPYTRPGFDSLFRLPDGRAQGFTMFTPNGELPSMIMAVSGRIYVSYFPYTTYTVISGIQFNPDVDLVVFKECLQGADNGVAITPKRVLIMQDGRSAPAYYDGSTARHTIPGGFKNETVMGLAMEWVGSRLWVARGNQIFASDIYDPLHFTENLYLSGGGSLQPMDGAEVFAMIRTADQEALLVFTETNTTLIQAGNTNRSTWQTAPGFISYIFPGVGCCAVKSPINYNGTIWWMSYQGARNYAQVGTSIRSSANGVSSIEMDRSFTNISPTIRRTCAMTFSSFVGFSLASGDLYNRHTWVLDSAIADQLNQDLPECWTGIWTGTRPVEWRSVTVKGVDRCFFLSQDRCGVRLWEAFKNTHEDNGGRIACEAELNGLDFQQPLAVKQYLFSEFYFYKLSGTVDLTVDYRTDWGCWKNLNGVQFCAQDEICSLPCGPNGQLQGQNRYLATPEPNQACLTQEGPWPENYGTFTQNRVRWYGKNGIRMYKTQSSQVEESSTGACTESDTTCKALSCCDQELDYWSHVNDHGYGSSSSQIDCSI